MGSELGRLGRGHYVEEDYRRRVARLFQGGSEWDREMEILNELSGIAFSAARGEYEEIRLEVEIKEHWIDAVFWETVDGVTESLPTL